MRISQSLDCGVQIGTQFILNYWRRLDGHSKTIIIQSKLLDTQLEYQSPRAAVSYKPVNLIIPSFQTCGVTCTVPEKNTIIYVLQHHIYNNVGVSHHSFFMTFLTP